MPRPAVRDVTFTIDGIEVTAPENTMLVDAAKNGDVEIPVFCYEPKLGAPVGACRMCLVEVEGIPKLQTGCSTPVKDGMVVHTQNDRVRQAQEAVVEFLLINHPLDCPVCDKGGECPLQDVSYGWGGGRSRFIEPKRHFQKPLNLSPLVAIDRERCILCYRCVRFSQEVSEDYQLILQERGAHTFVATFDGHPYVAPFSGNIIELCPVGALTSQPYRFRARPWDIEMSGTVCTLCPAQCNVQLTVRDDRVLRVMSRENEAVDDGWLCDKGRFAYQSVHTDERITQPMLRDGGALRPVTWERALEEAANGLRKAKGKVGALVGGDATNEEGWLVQRLVREALGSADVDQAAGGSGALPADLRRALLSPALGATVEDLEYAHAVLVLDCEPVDDMPIVDLRIRKGRRRRGVQVAVASARPSSLDADAAAVARFAPGAGEALLGALDRVLAGESADDAARLAGADVEQLRGLGEALRVGEDVVVLVGERLLAGPRGEHAARALLNLVQRLGLDGRPGAGVLVVPAGANGRGLTEVGVSPAFGAGLADVPTTGRDVHGIREAAAAGDVQALWLVGTDPVVEQGAAWHPALDKATTVIAHASFMTEGVREHATVVFPAEAYAEKDGTITHPDGRVQRLRPAVGHPGDVRAGWQVLGDLARRLDHDLGVFVGAMASQQLFAAVPFYAGLSLDELGGTGLRWPAREAASAFPAPATRGPFELEAPPAAAEANGRLRLGTYRSIWAGDAVANSPALKFLAPRGHAEMSPADAERLGLRHGDPVRVGSNGSAVEATVHLRGAMPEGSIFIEASGPDGQLVEVVRR